MRLPFRNYSAIAPDYLHPLSSDYWERKLEADHLRIDYKVANTSLASNEVPTLTAAGHQTHVAERHLGAQEGALEALAQK